MVYAGEERDKQKREYVKLQKDEGQLIKLATSFLRARSDTGAGLGSNSVAKRHKFQNADGR